MTVGIVRDLEIARGAGDVAAKGGGSNEVSGGGRSGREVTGLLGVPNRIGLIG